MFNLSEEELNKLTELCRIECTEAEKQGLRERIGRIIGYLQMLESLNTEGVEPVYSVLKEAMMALREDEVGDVLSREAFLANAPSHIGGLIRVPLVLKPNA